MKNNLKPCRRHKTLRFLKKIVVDFIFSAATTVLDFSSFSFDFWLFSFQLSFCFYDFCLINEPINFNSSLPPHIPSHHFFTVKKKNYGFFSMSYSVSVSLLWVYFVFFFFSFILSSVAFSPQPTFIFASLFSVL